MDHEVDTEVAPEAVADHVVLATLVERPDTCRMNVRKGA